MKPLLQHLLVFLSTLVINNNEAQESCCKTKTVSGGPLNGVYTLKKQLDIKPDPVCKDGCLYTKQDQPEKLFCFKQENYMHSVSCSDTTG